MQPAPHICLRFQAPAFGGGRSTRTCSRGRARGMGPQGKAPLALLAPSPEVNGVSKPSAVGAARAPVPLLKIPPPILSRVYQEICCRFAAFYIDLGSFFCVLHRFGVLLLRSASIRGRSVAFRIDSASKCSCSRDLKNLLILFVFWMRSRPEPGFCFSPEGCSCSRE